MLGNERRCVSKGDLVVGGLTPDFVHKDRKEMLEALGCYFHSPERLLDARLSRQVPLDEKGSIYKKCGHEVIFVREHDVKGRKLVVGDGDMKWRPSTTEETGVGHQAS